MAMRRIAAILPLLALIACETPGALAEPSLARRPAEGIDPRLPVDVPIDPRPVGPAVGARLETLLTQARASHGAFVAAEPSARAKAAAAGSPESESWVAAQLALSDLERARAPFASASGDLDELRAASARSASQASPAEIAALEAAASELMGMANIQAAALDSIRTMIAS